MYAHSNIDISKQSSSFLPIQFNNPLPGLVIDLSVDPPPLSFVGGVRRVMWTVVLVHTEGFFGSEVSLGTLGNKGFL